MTQLVLLNLSKLQVKEVGSLALYIDEKIGPLAVKNEVFVPAITEFKDALGVFNQSVGSDANPEQTKMLHSLDSNTDESFKVLKGLASTASNRRQPNVKTAGLLVENVIRKHGYELQILPIHVEVDRVEQLVKEIRSTPSLTAAITLIGGDADLDQLEADNNATKAYWLGMNDAKSTDTSIYSVTASRNLKASISKIFQLLNVMASFNADVEKVILALNPILEKYATTLKSRATELANAKEQESKKV